MTSRTVFSPAKEPVEIVPDDEWISLTGGTLKGLRQFHGWKPMVVEALWLHGRFTSKSGQATAELVNWVESHNPGMELPGQAKSIANLLKDTQNLPMTERSINGKRTHSIQLVALPETWHSKLLQQLEARKPPEPSSPPEAPVVLSSVLEAEARASVALDGETQSVGPVDGTEPEWTEADWEALKVDAPTVFETEPPIELHLASQVAMSLLTTVVEIITAGEADTTKLSASKRIASELDHVQGVLAQRLEENNRLRKQLREAQDIIQATRDERDGLRTRLRATEQNLQSALKGETAHAVNSEIHRRMDEIMRTAPKAKGD